jgi:hypothetical protein
MYEQSEDNVALATLGDRTTLTQAAATVTAEVLVGATAVDIKGRVYWTAEAQHQRGRGEAGRHHPRRSAPTTSSRMR